MRLSWISRLATAVALLAVLWSYWWTVSAVNGLGPPMREAPPYDYYNLLVSGFVKGHVYMDAPVAPALMALPDPYDPAQNEPHRKTDASYYRGHYYLYFGAAPAVTFLLPYRLLTGQFLPTPWAILVFCGIGFTAAAFFWLELRSRYFARAPGWTAAVGVLVIGVGSTAAVLLRRPFFWELATAGGFAFTMLGLLSVQRALHGVRRTAWMVAAGLALGLAVASRPTFLFATPLLALPLWRERQAAGITRRWWQMALGGVSAIGLIGVGVLLYNYERFGNPLETGHNYLLSIAYESKVRLFSLKHLWFNFRMYFLLPGQWSWHEPFFAPVPVLREEMPDGFYTVDDPFGLLRVFPVAALALLAPFALAHRTEPERGQLRALLIGVGVLLAASAGVILLYVATIPRYAVDFFPALALLTVIGLAVAAERLGRVTRLLLLAATMASLLTGSLAYFDAGRLMAHRHPDAIADVNRLTTRVEAWLDRTRGIHYGPVELTVSWPASPPTTTETLLLAGDPRRPDRLLVEYGPNRTVRFGLRLPSDATEWGPWANYDPAVPQQIGIDLGSFYPPLEHGLFSHLSYARATWIQHRVHVTLQGQPVLETFAPFAPNRNGAPPRMNGTFSGRVTTFAPRAPALTPDGDAANGPGIVHSAAGPGGVLTLDVVMPPGLKGAWVPIVQTGHPGAADVLSLYSMGTDVLQFRFDHWGSPLVLIGYFPVSNAFRHTLEIYFPSFDRSHFGESATGDVWVRFDGKEVFRTPATVHGFRPEELVIGENRMRATMDDTVFRGCFVKREWR